MIDLYSPGLQAADGAANFYENLIDCIPHKISWWDTQGVALGGNQAMLAFMGLCSNHEFIGMTYEKIAEYMGWTQHQALSVKQDAIDVMRTGIPKMNTEDPPVKTRRGELAYYLTSQVPLYNTEQKMTGVVYISTDITELKKKELLTTDYTRLIAYMPHNVYWLDKGGIGLGCNNNTAKFLGLNSPEESVGITYDKMAQLAGWTDQQDKIFRRDDLEVIATGRSKLNKEEPAITDSEGNLVYYFTSRVPLYNRNNEIIGVIGISTDITERKKMEERLKETKEAAEMANQVKTEFLKNMRHDIRTPLSGIIGVTDMLQQTLHNPEKIELNLELSTMLRESSQALLGFMNQILDAIKLDIGNIPILRKKFSLRKKIEEIIQLNRAKAREKQIMLSLQYAEALPNYFVGGVIRIQRIILELVTNALNFTHQGSVTVKVEKMDQQERQYIIKISISDTGIGIPLDKQSQIYARFKRLTPSYQGVYKGLGMGLAIVKEFVDELGGELYVESQPDQGSTFCCLFPLNAALLDTPEGAES